MEVKAFGKQGVMGSDPRHAKQTNPKKFGASQASSASTKKSACKPESSQAVY